MTETEVDRAAHLGQSILSPTPNAFSKSAAQSEWVASRYRDVQAVLADERFEVVTFPEGGPVGTIGWLRASVSRFINGAEHQRRREHAVAELRRLDPEQLRSAAYRRSRAALRRAGQPGERIDVMLLLARRMPMAAMAANLGIADPDRAAEQVIAVAAGYFPGSDAPNQRAAEQALAQLVSILEPAELELIVTRIALMVQACDGTAGLIGITLHILQDAAPAGADPRWSTDSLLLEALRRRPPLRASRRVVREPMTFRGQQLAAGAMVVCDVEVANQDPSVFHDPSRFDPDRRGPASLTFGYGVRPCPGQAQALGLAAGVVDAVRESCLCLPGEPVAYEPSQALRVPARLEVMLS